MHSGETIDELSAESIHPLCASVSRRIIIEIKSQKGAPEHTRVKERTRTCSNHRDRTTLSSPEMPGQNQLPSSPAAVHYIKTQTVATPAVMGSSAAYIKMPRFAFFWNQAQLFLSLCSLKPMETMRYHRVLSSPRVLMLLFFLTSSLDHAVYFVARLVVANDSGLALLFSLLSIWLAIVLLNTLATHADDNPNGSTAATEQVV